MDQLQFPSTASVVAPLPRSPTTTFPASPHLNQTPPFSRRTSEERNDSRGRVDLEHDTPRPSISSERGTSPTSTLLAAPRQRSTSAVSVDPPRLDAHRPVSSFLGDDPEFTSMFQKRDDPAPSSSSNSNKALQLLGVIPVATSPRSREPSTPTRDEFSGAADISVSAIEFPTSSAHISISGPSPDLPQFPGFSSASSSSSIGNKNLPTSPSGESPPSPSNELGVPSLNLRARQDSQGSISGLLSEDGGETLKKIKALMEKAKEKGEKEVTLSVESVEVLIGEAGKGREKYVSLKGKYDGIKVSCCSLYLCSRNRSRFVEDED